MRRSSGRKRNAVRFSGTLESLLGFGGMGVVYAARDLDLGRVVAEGRALTFDAALVDALRTLQRSPL